ncbi:MAG: hypothetical protein HLUCCO16_07665 [Phormidium sp. OSCR]|nr:MAG: hypothetical protein HLUCCO16_07665 [Phormidium sp. OSCR]
MSFSRIFVLSKTFFVKLGSPLVFLVPLIILLIGFIIVFPLSWNGENLTFLSTPIDAYLGSRDKVFMDLIHELLSWGWMLLSLYWVFVLFIPLSHSFLVSELLWIRLTPCLPIEVAAARVLAVIIYGAAFSLISVIWTIMVCVIKQVSWSSILLLDSFGIFSCIVLSGGLVVGASGLGINSSSRRSLATMISVIAALVPSLLRLINSSLSDILGDYSKFFPHATPFSVFYTDTAFHLASALLVGCSLLIFHVVYSSAYSTILCENSFEKKLGDKK